MRAPCRLLVAAASLAVLAGVAASPPAVSADDGTKPPPAAAPADPAIDGHVRALGDEAADVRTRAADELVRIGAPAAAALGAALSDPKLSAAAADVLARIGPPARAAMPQIVKALAPKPGPAPTAAIRAAAAMQADGRTAVPALLRMARAPGAASDRLDVVKALGTISAAALRASLRPANPADRAALAACAWLARHQNADGSWACVVFPERCTSTPRCTGSGATTYDVGISGLATLALLGSEARGGPEFTLAADRGLAALVAMQAKDGGIGITSVGNCTYSHGYATLALATALREGRESLREPVTRAVKRTLSLQTAKDGGWGYVGDRIGQSDTPLTTLMLDGLLRARDAGIDVPAEAIARGFSFLDMMTDPGYGGVGYVRRGGPSSRLEGMGSNFPASETAGCTGAALATRLFAGWRSGGHTEDPDRQGSMACVVTDPERLVARKRPRWDVEAGCIDLWYWCAGSRVFMQLGPASENYMPWRSDLLAALLPNQRPAKSGCLAGSWDPVDAWSPAGGRIYTTAFAAMALQSCAPDLPKFSTHLGNLRDTWNELERGRLDPDAAIAGAARRGADAMREAIFR